MEEIQHVLDAGGRRALVLETLFLNLKPAAYDSSGEVKTAALKAMLEESEEPSLNVDVMRLIAERSTPQTAGRLAQASREMRRETADIRTAQRKKFCYNPALGRFYGAVTSAEIEDCINALQDQLIGADTWRVVTADPGENLVFLPARGTQEWYLADEGSWAAANRRTEMSEFDGSGFGRARRRVVGDAVQEGRGEDLSLAFSIHGVLVSPDDHSIVVRDLRTTDRVFAPSDALEQFLPSASPAGVVYLARGFRGRPNSGVTLAGVLAGGGTLSPQQSALKQRSEAWASERLAKGNYVRAALD